MAKLTRTHCALLLATLAAWALQLAYVVMPLDLIPDVLPILGMLDDMVGLTGTLGLSWYTAKQLAEAGALPSLGSVVHERYEPLDERAIRAL